MAYAKLQVRVNGGAPQSGGITVDFEDEIQLTAESKVGWGSPPARWEIYDYPPGMSGASFGGWTHDAEADVYYWVGNGDPPLLAWPDSVFQWGKMMFRLIILGGLGEGYVDEATAVQVLSPSGLEDVAYRETGQFSPARQAVRGVKSALRGMADAAALAPYIIPEEAVTGDHEAVVGELVPGDPTAGAFEVTLPDAVGKNGQGVSYKNVSTSVNAVTFVPDPEADPVQTIDGSAAFVVAGSLAVQVFVALYGNWWAFPPAVGDAPPAEPVAFHTLFTSPTHVWDAEDITFSGMSLATWPPRVGGATLTPTGGGNGYLEDDEGYPSATFTGGGRLSGDVALSAVGTTWGYAVRFRATPVNVVQGCVVGWVTSPTPNAKWVVGAVYAANITSARFGQISMDADANTPSGGTANTGVGEEWQVIFVELDATTLYLTVAGTTYTCARPAGTAPFNRINVGYLNYNGASLLYPFSGAISHIVTVDGRRFTGPEMAAAIAWTPESGPPDPPPAGEDFHELVTSPRHVWDAADITFSGGALSTWPPRLNGATLVPDGSGNGYDDDDGGYASATLTGGGKLSGDCALSVAGTTWGYAVRYRATAVHGGKGCTVGWVTSPTPDAKWVVGAVYAANITSARFGQVSMSGGDTNTSSGGTADTGVGTAWQVMFVELDATTLYVTIAGVTYTCARPAGTAPFSRINVGYLNYNGASNLYPFSGAVSHIVTVDGRMFTGPEKTALAAWTPPA